MDTAASVLVSQQKTAGVGIESTRSTAPSRADEDTPSWLEGTPVAVPAPVTLEVHQTEPVVPGAPDSAQVPAEAVEDIATENVETARTEVTTEVVHQETQEAPVAGSSGENMGTPEAGPIQHPTEIDTAPEPHQEPLAVRDEENVPAEMTGPVQEEVPVMLLQTTAGLDPYAGQQEGPNENREASNVSPTPAEGGPGREESATVGGLPSVGSLERQGTEGEDTPIEAGTPHEGSIRGSTRDSTPEEEEADESQDLESEPSGGDDPDQEREGSPDGEASRDSDGQTGDKSGGSENISNNGDDQGNDQRREGDNTEAGAEDEEARPENPEQQEARAAQDQPGPVGGRPVHRAPTLPIRIMTRQEQARMWGLQYTGPCLLAGQTYPRVNPVLTSIKVAKIQVYYTSTGRIEIKDWTEKQILTCHRS